MFRYRHVSLYLLVHALFRDWVLPVGIPPTRNPQNSSLVIRRYAILFDTIHDNIQGARSGECPDYGPLGYVAVLVRLQVPSFQRIIWSIPSAKETEEVGSSEKFVLL
jgi:hypothetical protein